MKKFILPLLIVLAIVLTGCTIPLINKEVRMPWEKKPADVIKQAMTNAMNVKSSHYQTTVKIDYISNSGSLSFQNLVPGFKQPKVLGEEIEKVLPGINEISKEIVLNPATNVQAINVNAGASLGLKKVSISLTGEGDTDFNDLKNIKASSIFNLAVDTGALTVKAGGEFRALDGIVYLKINEIPNIPLLNQSLPTEIQTVINELAGQWLKIDPKEIQSLFTPYISTAVSPEVIGSQPEDVTKKYSELIEKLQPKIKDAFSQANIYNYRSSLPSEKINGIKTYHYKVTLNKEGLKSLIIKLAKLYSEEANNLNNSELPTSFDEEDVTEQIDEYFKLLNTASGEIWIGQEDLMIYKMSWHFVGKNPEVKNSNEAIIDFSSTFSDFNTPKNVKEPEGAKSIVDVYLEMAAKSTGKTTDELLAQKRDSQRLMDISQLRTALLLYSDDNTMQYPKTLDELSNYISKVPTNPTPGGVEYTYEPSKDFKFYSLSFVFEVGTSGYGPGLHIQTPEGIDKGKDSDSDGLTDEQENYFGTDVNKPDTDGDGYEDGNEVKNGFNPNGTGKLELNKYKFGQ